MSARGRTKSVSAAPQPAASLEAELPKGRRTKSQSKPAKSLAADAEAAAATPASSASVNGSAPLVATLQAAPLAQASSAPLANTSTDKSGFSVSAWLAGMGYSELEPMFREQKLHSKDIVCALTDKDLREIGISALGQRKKILQEVQKLSGATPFVPTPPMQVPPLGSPVPAPLPAVRTNSSLSQSGSQTLLSAPAPLASALAPMPSQAVSTAAAVQVRPESAPALMQPVPAPALASSSGSLSRPACGALATTAAAPAGLKRAVSTDALASSQPKVARTDSTLGTQAPASAGPALPPGWSEFRSLKFPGSCLRCRTHLPAGTVGYGHKPQGSQHWQMACSPLCAFRTAGVTPPASLLAPVPAAVAAPVPPAAAALSLSRAMPSGDEDLVQLAILKVTMRGLQYYRGTAMEGEVLELQREPSNAYDPNAIKALNANGVQFGHVQREAAKLLAPLLDAHEVMLEACLAAPPGMYYAIAHITVLGLAEDFDRINAILKPFLLRPSVRPRQLSQPELKKNATEGSPAWVPAVTTTTHTQSDNQLDRFAGDLSGGDLPMRNPPATLKCAMYPHQRQALHWLLSHEELRKDDVFYKSGRDLSGKPCYINMVLNYSAPEQPLAVRGSILADDMGLGKTIATLALIAQQKLSGQMPGPTLIISPLSVLANWRSQVEEHMLPGSLTVFTYQGAARQLVRLADLSKYDIVLSNYETVQAEFIPPANREEVHEPTVLDAKAGLLWGVNWARIVLDEAHRITSRTSKTFKAICALTATSRLVLTGTPINNRLEDFYAYVAFLRLSPLNHWALFQQTLIRPTKVSQEEVQRSAYARFQRLVAGLTLRRLKNQKVGDAPLLNLPPKTIEALSVQLSPAERSVYDTMLAPARALFQKVVDYNAQRAAGSTPAAAAAGGSTAPAAAPINFSNVLEALLRLRQSCTHVSLLGIPELELLDPVAALSPDVLQRVRNLIASLDNAAAAPAAAKAAAEDEADGCSICLGPLQNTLVTPCGHAFCAGCIEAVTDSHAGKNVPCPICRAIFKSRQDLLSLQEFRDAADSAADPASQALSQGPVAGESSSRKSRSTALVPEAPRKVIQPSSKQRILLKGILAEPQEKAIVISQWTGMLDLTGQVLQQNGIRTVPFDGRMKPADRDAALSSFRSLEPSAPQVLLLSLKAGGVGLNLTVASRVWLLDPWWNAAAEEQAIDRVYRIGQTKPVKVFRMLSQGTIEEKVMKLQEKKTELAMGAMSQRSAAELQAKRLGDIKLLLDM